MDHLFSRKATIIWTDFGQVNYKVFVDFFPAASEYQDFHASMQWENRSFKAASHKKPKHEIKLIEFEKYIAMIVH